MSKTSLRFQTFLQSIKSQLRFFQADSPGNPELRPSSPGCRIPECRLRPKSGFQRVGSAHRRTVQKDDGAPDRGEILD
uniref:Uncharacterized protein n=1 Tax=Caenorhabditis tropicalis TaxID=1561998 RepID=A0A1I7U673_9PELO